MTTQERSTEKAKPARCKWWQRPIPNEPCACVRAAWEGSADGYCICHSPENGRDNDTARQVWNLARQEAAGQCNFAGWHFPGDPDYKDFAGVTFAQDAYFVNVTFTQDVLFDNATFAGDANFSRTTFEAGAGFDHAVFAEGSTFVCIDFKGGANFNRCTFRKVASFAVSRIRGDAAFLHSVFEKTANFGEARFDYSARFLNAQFRGDTCFREVRFRNADFNGAVFEGWTVFTGATAVGFVRFSGHGGRSRPFRLAEYGESAYRLAKQTAQNAGDYAAAGGYHYFEQSAIDARMRKNGAWRPWDKNFWSPANAPLGWLRFLFGRLLFGYGEKSVRVLLAGLLVILMASLAFTFGGVNDMRSADGRGEIVHDFGAAAYFGVVTFTTLGYGDMSPPPGLRWLAALVACAGVCLMALFVVALARKFTR